MQLTILYLSTVLAGLAAAQSSPSLPTCATSCVTNSIPSNCNLDPKCICSASSFITAISCCVYKACDTADQQATLQYANSICNPVGVTNLPTAAGCSGTAASNGTGAASTAMSSGTGSSSMASITSSASGAAASSSSSSSVALSLVPTSASSSTAAATSASATGNAGSNLLMSQDMGAICAAALGVAALL